MVCKSWLYVVVLSTLIRKCPNILKTFEIPTSKPHILLFLVSSSIWWYVVHDHTELSCTYRISYGLWCDMIFIQRVVCFLSSSLGYRVVCFLSLSLGSGIESAQLVGRFFLSHIYHPIPVFIDSILWKALRRNTQCDNKKLSHECYHIDIKENNTGSVQISQILLKSSPLNYIYKITQVSDMAHRPLVTVICINSDLKLLKTGMGVLSGARTYTLRELGLGKLTTRHYTIA
jgi:hypothetical protein